MKYIKFICPMCSQPLEAPGEMAGDVINCPTCKETIEISFPCIAIPPNSKMMIKKDIGDRNREPKITVKRKYEFTGDTTEFSGTTLRRIVRLCDGEIGGWIENENNLSHSGGCWIFDKAKVYGNAEISEEAQVSSEATVSGDAKIYGNARVTGHATVFGNAIVFENAVIAGESFVSGNAKISGSAKVSGYCTSVGGNTILSGNERITSNPTLNHLSQKTPEDVMKTVAIKAMGILTFSTARWLKDKYGERPR